MGALIRAARRYDRDRAQKRDGGDDGGATIGHSGMPKVVAV